MDIGNSITNLFNPVIPVGTRIMHLIIIIVIVAIIDGQLGFSYHYFTSKKIEEIEGYNKILQDRTLDSSTINLIKKERLNAISAQRVLFIFSRQPSHKNDFLVYLSSLWIIGILMLIAPYLLIRTQTLLPKSALRSQIIMVEIILLIEVSITSWIGSLLSDYIQSPMLYIINAIIQIIFLTITFWLANKVETKKNMNRLKG